MTAAAEGNRATAERGSFMAGANVAAEADESA